MSGPVSLRSGFGRAFAAFLGQDHPDTAHILHNLAIIRQRQGDLNEALSFAGRTLNIRSQVHGVTHPNTMATQTLYNQLLSERQTEASQRHTQEPLNRGSAT